MLAKLEVKLIILLIRILGIIGACFYSYEKGVSNGKQSCASAALKVQQIEDKKITVENTKIASNAKNLVQKQTTQKKIENKNTEEVKKEISAPVYQTCIIPPSGVGNLNETVNSLNNLRKQK